MTPKQLHAEILENIEKGISPVHSMKEHGYFSSHEYYRQISPLMKAEIQTKWKITQSGRFKNRQKRNNYIALSQKYELHCKRHFQFLLDNEKKIIEQISRLTKIDKYDFFLPCRIREISEARYILMHVLESVFSYTLNHIADIVCVTKMNHTSIIHGIKSAKNLSDTDETYYSNLKDAELYAKSIISIKSECPMVTGLHGKVSQSLH